MQNLYITNVNSDSDPTPIKTSYPVRIHPFVNSDKKCSINEETNKTRIRQNGAGIMILGKEDVGWSPEKLGGGGEVSPVHTR